MKYSNESLLTEEIFSKNEILNAALVTHPHSKQINLTKEELGQTLIFENGSNLTLLKNPIVDEYGNEYRCSEWYYKARKLYDLEQDEGKRIEFMRNAIREKFDNNPELKAELLATWDRDIIEYTYRWDVRFWIDQNTWKWKNILWKLLMEYRDNNK